MSTPSKQLPLPPRVLLALILSIGLFCVWLLGWMMFENVIRSYLGSTGFKQLVFTQDGEPLISTYPAGNRELIEPIYHTLDGKLVPNPSEIILLDDYPREVLAQRSKTERASPMVNWGMGLLGFSALSPTRTYWYLIHDFQPDGSAYFVGYDALTGRQIGYFGRRGFTSTIPPEKDRIQIPFLQLLSGGWDAPSSSRGNIPRYEPQRSHNILMISGDELLKINLSNQTVAPIPMPDKVITLGKYTQHLPVMGSQKSEEVERVVVRLPEELQFLDVGGEPQGRLPIPPNLRDKSLTLRSVDPAEIIVESTSADRYAPHELTWLSADGNVLRSASIDIYQRPAEGGDFWMITVIVPVPGLIAAFAPFDALNKVESGEAPDMRTALLELIRRFAVPYALLLVVSLALAIWTYRRHRRYESPGALAWAVFVLLLGPLGFVAYLVHRSWPVRTACEHCGRPSPRNRGACLACEQPFAAPELRGVEVFA
jgi:hypothetical protein